MVYGSQLPARGTVPRTATGIHGKKSLVNGCNAAKGSRQISRVPWEDTMAPEVGSFWCLPSQQLIPRCFHASIRGLYKENCVDAFGFAISLVRVCFG